MVDHFLFLVNKYDPKIINDHKNVLVYKIKCVLFIFEHIIDIGNIYVIHNLIFIKMGFGLYTDQF